MKCLLLVFVLTLAVSSCAAFSADGTESLPNGMYEVVAAAIEPARLPEPGSHSVTLVFDREFLSGGDAEPPEHLLLNRTGYAPLDLAGEPRVVEDGGRARLLLSLEPGAAAALTALTSHARRIAVVIGGKAVTAHGVKEPLRGTGFQVSC